MAKVPSKLKKDLDGREKAPLGPGGLVRFQRLGRGPGIGRNYRVVVMEDGRYYEAQNERGEMGDGKQVYNVPLPSEPTGKLPAPAIEMIRASLGETRFFEEEEYVARETVRDGSLAIVTARLGGKEHEVWYLNVSTPLTELLQEIINATGPESSWADLLEEQVTLRSKLEDR